MKEKKFDAVAMVRKIRDAHYERLKDSSREEILEFYRSEAEKVNAEARRLLDQRATLARHPE